MAFLDAISKNLESNDPHEQIERNIREQINIIADNVSDLENLCVDLEKDQKSLKVKIERRQQDIERAEKRFRSLKKVCNVPVHTCIFVCVCVCVSTMGASGRR